ncbi:MAG TPA: glycosyltransferase family 87 protein [Candidatus Krumholzibacteria bacterium]|nr:glycosyltransferase family 87 protein [Candidatus Krumholzibacteria bacterium]
MSGNALQLGGRSARFALLAVVCCWAGVFLAAWLHVDGYQWDFRTYYYASHAFEQGLNPYTIDSLMQASDGHAGPLRFVYPLSALYVFKPLARLDYATAARIWLLLKAAALIGLFAIWRRYFLPSSNGLWIALVGMLAFQATMLWDIKAGNVSTFEQLFLWAGLAFLLHSRPRAFAACVVVASLFKLTLSAFLLLLLVKPLRSRGTVATMATAFVTLGVIAAVPFATHRDYLQSFVAAVGVQPAWLSSNVSFQGIATELIRQHAGFSVFGKLSSLLLAAVPAGLSLLVGRRLLAKAYAGSPLILTIMIACFAYALVVPRMMIYSYSIVIAPLLGLVLPCVGRMRIGVYAFAALVCIGGLQVLPSDAGTILDSVQPLVLLLLCWGVLIGAEKSGALDQALLESSHP